MITSVNVSSWFRLQMAMTASQQYHKHVGACLFCGSPDHVFRFEGRDRWHEVPGAYSVHECNQCGLLFLNPQPSPAEVAAHYPAGYYAFASERPDDARDERLYRTFFGPASSPLRRILALPYRIAIRTMLGAPGQRVLDVGCGAGTFLGMARRILDVEAYGVEPYFYDPVLAQKNGLKIFNGLLEQAAFPDDFFDVITLNHVFEHLTAPRSTLIELRRILKPGGTLIIALPQKTCLLYWLFGRRWFQLDVPRHMFVPSCKNLTGLAISAGFKVRRVRFNGKPDAMLGTLFYWWNDLWGRRRYFHGYKQSVFWFRALLPLAYVLNFFRLGDQIELLLTKG